MTLKKNSKIFLAGHKGMVGSSILKLLKKKNYKKIYVENRLNLDLTNQEKMVLRYLQMTKVMICHIE
jgi:GDP-L-fucose synthase